MTGWLRLGHYPRHVVSERFEPRSCAALVQSLWVLDRTGPEVAAGDGELSAIQLRLPGTDSHPVLQVSQVCLGGLAPGHRAAQGIQKCPLRARSAIGVLGEQERCLGAVLADQRSAWPAPGGQQITKPAGVVVVDPLPFRGDLVREPDPVLAPVWGGQLADPLILITPSQQFLPQFFVHVTISARRA
jgi:hypothetical protein